MMAVYRITANSDEVDCVTHGCYADEDGACAAMDKLYPKTDSTIYRKCELMSLDDTDLNDIIEDYEMSQDWLGHESEFEPLKTVER